ncbi:UGT80A2, partial [Symbiodinium microadriaticum]
MGSESDGDRAVSEAAREEASSPAVNTQSDEDEFVLINSAPTNIEENATQSKSSISSYLSTFYGGGGKKSARKADQALLSDASLSSYLYSSTLKHRCFTGHSKVMLVAGEDSSASARGVDLNETHAPRWRIPIPHLRIVIMAVGTRGDVQPFALLGKRLMADGHRVRLATHACFRDFVLSYDGGGLEFYPLAGDPVKLSEFMVKTHGCIIPTDPGVLKQVPQNILMLNDILNSCWGACVEADPTSTMDGSRPRKFMADAIISNPVTYGHIHCAEALGVPLHLMFPQPWVPTKAFPHPLACMSYSEESKWSTENYLSYQLVERMLWMSLEPFVNIFRQKRLGLMPIRRGEHGWNLLNTNKVPFLKMWSKYLVPKPKDWGGHVEVAGFFLEPAERPQ